MLQDAQRTSAPSATSVSMRTAVCTVMCSEPVMRAPFSGWLLPYSVRMAIKPGISCSARSISLRPNSASDRSATLKSTDEGADVIKNSCFDRVMRPGYRLNDAGALRRDRFRSLLPRALRLTTSRCDGAHLRHGRSDRERERSTGRVGQRMHRHVEQLERRGEQYDGKCATHEPARCPRREPGADVDGGNRADGERNRQTQLEVPENQLADRCGSDQRQCLNEVGADELTHRQHGIEQHQ